MNTVPLNRSITTHRKTAISFRNASLLGIFVTAITTLRNISQMQSVVGENRSFYILASWLFEKIITFDFLFIEREFTIDHSRSVLR